MPLDYLLSPCILDGDIDWCTVGSISKTAFMGGDALVNSIGVRSVRKPDGNVCVSEPEAWVDIRGHFIIRFKDIFDIDVDEVIERVDMLFDQSFYF